MELRKYERYPSENLFDFIAFDEHDNTRQYAMGKTLDICVDGLRMETNTPIRKNVRLQLTLELGDHLIDIEGVTVHSGKKEQKFITGLSFLKVARQDRRILEYYIDRLQ